MVGKTNTWNQLWLGCGFFFYKFLEDSRHRFLHRSNNTKVIAGRCVSSLHCQTVEWGKFVENEAWEEEGVEKYRGGPPYSRIPRPRFQLSMDRGQCSPLGLQSYSLYRVGVGFCEASVLPWLNTAPPWGATAHSLGAMGLESIRGVRRFGTLPQTPGDLEPAWFLDTVPVTKLNPEADYHLIKKIIAAAVLLDGDTHYSKFFKWCP